MSWRVPLADLDIGAAEYEAVHRVLESRWLTMGQLTQQFEEQFATLVSAKHAIAVTNCTAGLHLACLALGIGDGDEVIVPSLTFVATAAAVRYTGATPVFADLTGHNDLTLSPGSIEEHITQHTRAIMVMHYGGYACDMPAILDIAQRHNLVVIEDAAHAVGSTLEGKALGTWGAIGCYSFFSNKNLATGEGGMLVTNDDQLAEKIRLQRSHGMTHLTWDRHQGHAWSYDVVDLGYNYRIDELRAAIGLAQLQRLMPNNERRRWITDTYRVAFKLFAEDIQIPFVEHRGVSACHIFPVLLAKRIDRTTFMKYMKEMGIQTSIHYPPVHEFEYYRKNQKVSVSLPLTEEISAREVTLPLYPTMRDEAIETVISAVKKVLQSSMVQ